MKITIAMSNIAIAKEVYERLEAYRQARGLSQETLVENLGISRPTYARIQKGTCSLGTFIGVLRELSLLEGFNALVPAPTVRPSEVVRAHKRQGSNRKSNIRLTPKHVKATVTGKSTGQNSVKAMLANRTKNKVMQ
ncbi:helix-turn-helix domain-containing protein [Xenorhabdus nematophila]|uniref:helix-turn-helix domain-containing protein n=1 Tax=Xenorhabdus nematophila TaxID=628 RepID=UPI000542B803|nr:helix-turn-helix transcriptional regulator [Xenorhabdus nematophila]CEE90675.1 putative transcriptional regulator (Cro/CI family) [Xenorhabdus nematophila str. Anatoliense]CEF33249.1 putative transcriptional regulator (Cro/CI family) [Xenorhabdus nematophila str. Websteri]AYA42228.1 XRE family transcriptional regulator [Xenorhabdus nematophila]KHD28044.1 Cro/Cl family transcriptional regulator [Xenorhabdus nematophila]MBA0020953.1 helix-turn-helix domain-containing protein [Xenorhabdus nema